MERKPLVYLSNGDIGPIPSGDTLNVPKNFSIKEISSLETITIPQKQQMLLSGAIKNLGELKNFGQIVLISQEDKDEPTPPFPELPGDNYSVRRVDTNEQKLIPKNQQMLVHGAIKNLGTIKNLGEIYFVNDDNVAPDVVVDLPPDNYSHKIIASGAVKSIPQNQQMIVAGMIKNLGTLVNLGSVAQIQVNKPEQDDQYLPPYIIESGELFKIGRNRILSLGMMFKNFGTLKNLGIFELRE